MGDPDGSVTLTAAQWRNLVDAFGRLEVELGKLRNEMDGLRNTAAHLALTAEQLPDGLPDDGS